MQKTTRYLPVAIVASLSFLVGVWYTRHTSPNAAAESRQVLRYICPMHPQYVSDRPGEAPCCGMRLEPVYADGSGAPEAAGNGHALPAGAVAISPERQQLIGIQIDEVRRTGGEHVLRTPGRVVSDETLTFTLNAAVDGWIREVHPPTTGSQVEKDQPLATFYSKEFLPAQQNYFYALNTLDRMKSSRSQSPEQVSLTNVQVWSQEDILESLGMGQSQIAELAKTRQFTRNVVIRAPAAGFVLARNVSPGQRFQRGEELYRIADLSRVWILADLFENEAARARTGQTVPVRYQGRTFHARVSEILPQFDSGSRTLKLRLEMDNAAYTLRPDMFVDIEFAVKLPPAVTVPADAVLDSGLRKTVFLDRGNGVFEPRSVETGWRFGDRVEIRRGLEPGDRIVVAGNFLIDSESRMKTAAAGVQAPAKDPVCGMDVDRVKAKAAGRASEHQGNTYYFCSDHCKQRFDKDPASYLPENPAEDKAGPAKDPVCGMDVDPATARWKSTHQGKTYFFCAAQCKKQFDSNPGRYIK